MFLARLIIFFAETITSLISLYTFVVFASCLLSFVNPDPYNPIVRFIRGITEPAFTTVRRYIPFTTIGGLDLSPLVLILFLQLIASVVIPELVRLILTVLI